MQKLILFFFTAFFATFLLQAQTIRIPLAEKQVSDADFAVNKIAPVWYFFPELKGKDLTVSIKEKPFDTSDVDFKGRIVLNSSFSQRFTNHATIIASLIGGAGNTSAKSRGIVPEVRITSSDFINFLPDNGDSLLATGVSVQNHSYGAGDNNGLLVENFYGKEALAYDRHCRMYPSLLHVFSSGNAGNQAGSSGKYAGITGFANLTGQFKLSKNTLSVGATDNVNQVALLSSKGPAFDGRIKPELVAYGSGGSSESAALVSGTALLMQQAFQVQTGILPSAALLKAILINSADDIASPNVDFESGFGNLDGLGAVRTVREKRFFQDNVKQQETRKFTITVPEGIPLLKITLAWHDIESTENTEKALINDLDLEVHEISTGKIWKPWILNTHPHPDSLKLPATRGVDHLNNIEQVTILSPQAGNYEIRVSGFAVTGLSQAFAIAYEYEKGIEWLTPVRDIFFEARTINVLRWNFSKIMPESTRLEYRLLDTGNWQSITENISLTDGFYYWQVPEKSGLAQVRLITNTWKMESDTFVISKPITIETGFICDDKLMLYWNPEPLADKYQVMKLGERYLELLTETTDTLVITDIKQAKASRFTVVPIIQNLKGTSAFSVDYQNQNIRCYFRNFIASQTVADTIVLYLEIGTYYRLQNIVLEKIENGNFIPIQSLSAINQLYFTFTDTTPLPGLNAYRIRLVTDTGENILSDVEYVFSVTENKYVFYPNPVTASELLNIVVKEETALIEVFDLSGKIVLKTEETGLIKNLDTRKLSKGVYILRISGRITGKLVIL